jgi:hypothetical protein
MRQLFSTCRLWLWLVTHIAWKVLYGGVADAVRIVEAGGILIELDSLRVVGNGTVVFALECQDNATSLVGARVIGISRLLWSSQRRLVPRVTDERGFFIADVMVWERSKFNQAEHHRARTIAVLAKLTFATLHQLSLRRPRRLAGARRSGVVHRHLRAKLNNGRRERRFLSPLRDYSRYHDGGAYRRTGHLAPKSAELACTPRGCERRWRCGHLQRRTSTHASPRRSGYIQSKASA